MSLRKQKEPVYCNWLVASDANIYESANGEGVFHIASGNS